MAETIHVRGEGGAVIAMDLPLPESIQERYDAGLLQRVHPDGTPWFQAAAAEPAPPAVPDGPVRPGATARKPEWVAWAVAAHAMSAEDADALTLGQLKDLPEEPAAPVVGTEAAPAAAAAAAGRPTDDAPKGEWVAFVVRSGRMSAEDAAAYTREDLIDLMS
ncbi:hypothetical protein ACFQ71_12190 [Streptomyces sp. NPDC056534]|uniref:hypothetical protein n=1 Tax=Streptomyces sp. NPDC056534 TaxID=3345857 RepID=UPI0036CE0D71